MDHLKRRDDLAPDIRDDLSTTLVNESPNVSLCVALFELGSPAASKNMGQATLDIDRDSSFQDFVDPSDLLKTLSYS